NPDGQLIVIDPTSGEHRVAKKQPAASFTNFAFHPPTGLLWAAVTASDGGPMLAAFHRQSGQTFFGPRLSTPIKSLTYRASNGFLHALQPVFNSEGFVINYWIVALNLATGEEVRLVEIPLQK